MIPLSPIVHQVRNSLKYIPYKDYRVFAAGLKTIYQAADEQQALTALEQMEATWGKNMPQPWKTGDEIGSA